MKTTLDINDHRLANAKVLAVQQRTSLTRLIEEGLQLRLRSAASPASAPRSRMPVLKGRGGLVAGVNPISNKALLGALDPARSAYWRQRRRESVKHKEL